MRSRQQSGMPGGAARLFRIHGGEARLNVQNFVRSFVDEARRKRNVNGYTFRDPFSEEKIELRFLLAGGGASSSWYKSAIQALDFSRGAPALILVGARMGEREKANKFGIFSISKRCGGLRGMSRLRGKSGWARPGTRSAPQQASAARPGCQNGSVQDQWVVAGSNPAAPTTPHHWSPQRQAMTACLLAQRSGEGDQYARVGQLSAACFQDTSHCGSGTRRGI